MWQVVCIMYLKSFFQHARSFMSVPVDNPDLLLAQYKAFSKQIPLMYCILLANTWSLSYDFIGTAPDWLSVYAPVLLSVICIIRLVNWLRVRDRMPTADDACKALNRTNRLASIIAIIFASWSIALFPYGSEYGQAHVAFYMAITVIGVIFCLMHLRPAAFTVALIVNTIFIGFFGLSNVPTFVATAINVFAVSVAMLVILMVYYRDFTEMVAARVENFRLANVDVLTNLPNRRHFFTQLKSDFVKAKADSVRLTVGLLDLDGFKPINDLYGHAAGDELLNLVGKRLKDVCEDKAYVARLGGDEFAFILASTCNDAALELGEEVCAAIREPYELEGMIIEVSATIGFAAYPDLQLSSETDLFERADYALYQGKRSGRGGIVKFSANHDAEIQRDVGIERALRIANLQDELSVLFQPVVDMRSGDTVAFEALARWSSSRIGFVSPGLFIPVAERAGIVHKLTRVLLGKALEQAALWPAHIRLSFNLSARDICNRSGSSWLIDIITTSCFDPRRIDFEITETSMLHDFDQAIVTVNALKALGCGISLDDFGTGYSSLSQLHSLPLNKIKVDRSFVTELHRNPASYKIVKSLIALSRDMGLECIVEGVETIQEVAALKALGCTFVQGYHYSKPLSGQAALNFIAKHAVSGLEQAG